MDQHTAGGDPHSRPSGMTRVRDDMGSHHDAMMRDQHRKTLWVHFTSMALGAWLIASPATFGYPGGPLTISDLVSGAVIIIFAALSFSPDRGWSRWANCFIGIWLLFAPLVFWAPTAAGYINDTLIGALVIAFSVLVPGMPGMSMEAMMSGPDIPPGWTYNPSSWPQRAPMIALALVSFLLSRYLAAHQLGYIADPWDPLFGNGTWRVLNSDVSRAWPVSDAGLGALTYMLEVLSGFMGDKRRWRTMPWMVLMFFFLVVPLGVTSIVLVMLQPVSVGAWCTLCLTTAVLMLIMIPLAVDEVVAMGQFLVRIRHEGKPFWHTFWRGGTLDTPGEDTRTPSLGAQVTAVLAATWWGVTVPWTLLGSALLGMWIMSAPAVLGTRAIAANSDYIAGALIITTAVFAMAEVTRAARFINVLLAIWIAVAPWILTGATMTARWGAFGTGAILIALSLPRGVVRERYAGWDGWIV